MQLRLGNTRLKPTAGKRQINCRPGDARRDRYTCSTKVCSAATFPSGNDSAGIDRVVLCMQAQDRCHIDFKRGHVSNGRLKWTAGAG